VNTVIEALRAARLAPERLELELTEGILLRNSDEVMRTLAELKALGVHLSVDDFGTGYSSLSYLKRFAPHTLKIDRSFIRDVTSSRDDAAIVTAILAMARSLKFQVVAEGVENAEQLAFLSAHGCDLVQGFFFSPAVPAEKLPSLLGATFTRRLASGQN
jgi:EAL domain-containing protein (putative c-di-GMP-specific phosphodiesterase class I)